MYFQQIARFIYVCSVFLASAHGARIFRSKTASSLKSRSVPGNSCCAFCSELAQLFFGGQKLRPRHRNQSVVDDVEIRGRAPGRYSEQQCQDSENHGKHGKLKLINPRDNTKKDNLKYCIFPKYRHFIYLSSVLFSLSPRCSDRPIGGSRIPQIGSSSRHRPPCLPQLT